jgi:hypothetical protein
MREPSVVPRWEYDLRLATSTARILMQRIPGGIWKDIARFDSYNDAEHILRLIRKALLNGPVCDPECRDPQSECHCDPAQRDGADGG